MASIEKRISQDGKTSYRVKIRLRGHPPATETFGRLTDARRWAAQTETAIRQNQHFKSAEAQKRTVAELLDRYVETVLPHKGSQKENQLSQLLWWKKELGHYTLLDLTPSRIAECRDKLLSEPTHQGDKRSPATTNRFLAVLSHACTVAEKEWGWLESNPVRKVTRPKEPRGRVRFLSTDERRRLLEACEQSRQPYLYLIVVLALSTGMRQGEITTLTWADVDTQRGRVVLQETKNGERRVVPIAGLALELLRDHAKVRRIDTPLLWPSSRKPSAPANIREPWLAALKAAEIDDLRLG